MSFENKYKKITGLVREDLNILEQNIKNLFEDTNPLCQDLSNFLTAPAKRLRPLLGILFLKNIFNTLMNILELG